MPTSFDPNDFDQTVRPVDDFFHYVSGGWIKRNPIPADESSWDSFTILRVQVEGQLKAILEDLATGNMKLGVGEGGESASGVGGAASSHAGTSGADGASASAADAQKIRDLYLTGMDVEARNRAGVAPLAELLAKIDGLQTIDEFAGVVGFLHRHGVGSAWWTPFAEQDEKKSEVVALHLYQGGLGLPDRDYYLNDDEKSRTIREKYLAYIRASLGRLGNAAVGATTENGVVAATTIGDMTMMNTLASQAAKIFEIEKHLATASRTRVELRDPEAQYNRMTPAELAVITPRVNWQNYFEAIGIAMPEYFIVGQPKFFAVVDQLFETTPVEDIKLYLRWHTLRAMANYLSEDIERERFDFYGRTFAGAKEMKPLWRRVLMVVDDGLGESLGKLYVARHFGEDAKRKINVLVDNLIAAYRARIEKLDWMGDETKKKAIEKLGAISRKLGYPDAWRDMSALVIGTDSYAANVIRAWTFEFDRKMKEVGGPVDRTEWFMTPQTVNAYYQPPLNEIAFPAAILQPPFFDPNADDALNFGGIGSVIGHELTHGFDDQGALFDAQGNLKNWWTAEDKARFDKKAAHFAEQYDKYEAAPGVFVNGKLTLGENIADLGGIIIAHDGLTLAVAKKNGIAAAAIAGGDGTVTPGVFTSLQEFFINYAITERGHAREERRRLLLQIDPHSPSLFRVNGPLSNMDYFYEAFGAKEGDKLWRPPEDRVEIW